MNTFLRRSVLATAAAVIVAVSGAIVHAQERPRVGLGGAAPDRQGDNQAMQRRWARFADRFVQQRMDPLAAGRAAVGADAVVQVRRWLTRYGDSRLISSDDLNPVDQAHIEMAEIHLVRKEYQACMDRLQRIVDEAEREEKDAVWLARLNRANVSRQHIGNMLEAVREYKLVRGRWAAFAVPLLLDCYDELGRLDEAVDLLAKEYDPDDPGLKLGLLRVVAEMHRRHGDVDMAYQCYERITKEFSREQIERFIAEAAAFGETKRIQSEELAEQGNHLEAEKVRKEAAGRVAALRAQGRVEEADAVEITISDEPTADVRRPIVLEVPEPGNLQHRLPMEIPRVQD